MGRSCIRAVSAPQLIAKQKHEASKLDPESIRKGVPFTIYLTVEQAEALASVSQQRRVSKSTVIRFALERLLDQIAKGQLQGPFGM
jgi:hypothetical protein